MQAMSMNIKDPEAHKLARALAQETGETITQAVTEALRERLERVRRRRKPEATAADLLEIGRRCARTLKGPALDHATLLYDERGLPR
jgi:antitoxin VapB